MEVAEQYVYLLKEYHLRSSIKHFAACSANNFNMFEKLEDALNRLLHLIISFIVSLPLT
jgi:hypothetical protein